MKLDLYPDIHDIYMDGEHPKPWALTPLDGKYYGTQIVDAAGNEVLTVWTAEGEPSSRQKDRFGGRWTKELWDDYCSDSHWECELDLKFAEWIIRQVNGDAAC